ncbi:hypothetical protein KY326_00265 [Candidatus Woesearchaeota archaeon]|nr:hypothetical protein [Candidatus Woesearchaeota archaeon]
MKNKRGQETWVSKEYMILIIAVVGLFLLMTFGMRICTSLEQEATKGSFESFTDFHEGVSILTSTKNLTKCGVELAFQDNEALVGFSAGEARVNPKVGFFRGLTKWISDTRINWPEMEYCSPDKACIVLCNIEGTPNADDCRGTLRLEVRELENVTKIKSVEGSKVNDLVYYGDSTGKVEYLVLEKAGRTAPYMIYVGKGDADIKPCQSAVTIAKRKFGEKPEFEKLPTIEEIEIPGT